MYVEGVSDAINTWIMLADSIWDADMNATLPSVTTFNICVLTLKILMLLINLLKHKFYTTAFKYLVHTAQ